jgi:hypothetical protein
VAKPMNFHSFGENFNFWIIEDQLIQSIRMKKFLIIILLLIFIASITKAQYFQTGQDPSPIRWKQINTTNFQIIYPEDFEFQAQRLSFVLEKVYNFGSATLEFKPRKVSVILHTRTVVSNGLVAWAPKRIELFTTPNQQIYSQDWLEQLALHEFRHLVQMDKIQSEMPGLLKIIFGEQATAVVVGAYLPFWFLEGDAVVTETALSKSGRGREASFSMEYRALLAEKGKYSFDKAYMGSYKDFVPDHYQLGYFMVGKSREEYGSKIWADALNKIGNHPLSLTPLNSSLRKSTGQSTKQLYSGIFDELKESWYKSAQSRTIDSISIVSPSKKVYTSYLFPEFYNDSILVAYRTAMNDIGHFVLIGPDKSEKVIFTPGTIFEESVSMQKNLLIWAEKRADLRWTHADRSVIQILNIETGENYEIHNENKLQSPAISPDLKSFAAVEIDHANKVSLSVFDLKDGKLIDRFSTPDNQYFFTPCWDEKGEKLYFVSLSPKGKYLAEVDMKDKIIKQLTEPSYANVQNPVYSGNKVFFSSDFSGVDNIYSLDLANQKITEIASVPFGADYPAISKNGSKIAFSNYSSGGYQLGSMSLNLRAKNNEIHDIQLKTDSLAKVLADQELGIPDFSNPDSVRFSSKKYSKLGHLFNFHSWAPAYIDVNSYEVHRGVSIFSQNALGTAETRLGYDYNVSDKTGKYRLGFDYKGFFPELSIEVSAGNEASNYYLITNTVNRFNQVISSDTTLERFVWHELALDLDARVPLNLSRGKYSRILSPEIQYSLKNISGQDTAIANLYPENSHALSYRVYLYNLLRQSGQALQPKWGQQLDLIYRHTPFGGNDLGTLSGIQSVLYFPGFGPNSGLRIYQGYQEKKITESHSFSNFVRFPRGFQGYQNNKMYSLAADYKLPLFYPDYSFGKLVYIKRVKSSFFYDWAWLSIPVLDNQGNIVPNDHVMKLQSLGFELTSDLHVLRFFAPIEIGFRTIYRPEYQDFQFNLLFSINFNGF